MTSRKSQLKYYQIKRPLKLILPNSYLKQYKEKILRKEIEVQLNNEKQQVNNVDLMKKNASFDSSNQMTPSNSTLEEETTSSSLNQKFFSI